MSNIRVAYSGLIAFVVGLVSVVTGLVVTLIITRNLTPEEFGTWSLILSMISYFLISEGIIVFWTVRQIARGEQVGKTSVSSALLFSFGAIPFYVIVSYIVSGRSNTELDSMILGAILVPLFFVSRVLNGINTAHRPQTTSYGLLVFEAAKIPTALAFVYFLDFGLDGTIIAFIIAYVIQIAVQLYFAKPKLGDKLNFSVLKQWIKLSWISLYWYLSTFIVTLDILIYTLMIGSVIGVAFYSASLAIASIILHSQKISQALYPKLLAKGNHLHVQENFSLLMYFAIPLLGIAIIFSKPAIFALNPAYQEASLIVIILAFKSFFLVLSNTLRQTLIGIEQVDAEKEPKFSKLLKSNLFHTSTIWIVKSIIYLVALVIILWTLNLSGTSEIEMTTYWALILLIVEIPFFGYFLFLVSRSIQFSFPYSNIAKYVGATVAFMIVYYFTSEYIITYHESIFDFMPLLISQLAICVGVYLAITYGIDMKTKKLFKSVFNELLFKKNNSN